MRIVTHRFIVGFSMALAAAVSLSALNLKRCCGRGNVA